MARRQEEVADVRRGLLPPLLVAGSFAALVLVQPDLGNCLTLVALTFGLLYLAGSPVRYLAWAIAPALPLLALAIYAAPYRLRRVTAFWDPWADPRGSGFQIIQSLIAVGSGGLLGRGYLKGTQTNLDYVPRQHTDFIFTVAGEEFGFVGAMFVLLLYALILWRAIRIATLSKDPFGTLVAAGIASMFAIQMFVNVGMVIGIMPITGIPLPFLSYGGSSILVGFAAIGMLESIHMRRFS